MVRKHRRVRRDELVPRMVVHQAVRVTIGGVAHYRLWGEGFTICAELVPLGWTLQSEREYSDDGPVCRCCWYNFKSALGEGWVTWAFNPGGPVELGLAFPEGFESPYRKLVRWSRLRIQ